MGLRGRRDASVLIRAALTGALIAPMERPLFPHSIAQRPSFRIDQQRASCRASSCCAGRLAEPPYGPTWPPWRVGDLAQSKYRCAVGCDRRPSVSATFAWLASMLAERWELPMTAPWAPCSPARPEPSVPSQTSTAAQWRRHTSASSVGGSAHRARGIGAALCRVEPLCGSSDAAAQRRRAGQQRRSCDQHGRCGC